MMYKPALCSIISALKVLCIIAVSFLCEFGMGTLQAKPVTNPLELHRQALVFDGHADTFLRVIDLGYQLGERHTERHVDIPRMRQGGVDVQFFSIWVDPRKYAEKPSQRALALIAAVEDQVQKNPHDLVLVRTAKQARQAVKEGKIAVAMGVEGGHAIEDDLELLRQYHARGVRYMTLTWMNTNNWADSSDDEPRWGGLNDLGAQVVREMNRLGMMVDVSHTSQETVMDVLAVTRHPVILSHSNARALCDIPRNVSDEVLKAVAKNGGVIGVNYYLGYLVGSLAKAQKALKEKYKERDEALKEKYGPDSEHYLNEHQRLSKEYDQESEQLPGRMSDYRIVVDHIDHIAKVAGIDHVGLGSDFDGVSLLPQGLQDVSQVPRITEELAARGYSERDIRKILGENFMRVFEKVCGE